MIIEKAMDSKIINFHYSLLKVAILLAKNQYNFLELFEDCTGSAEIISVFMWIMHELVDAIAQAWLPKLIQDFKF